MSTTSSFRADAFPLLLLLTLGCASASTAPDAPLTAAPDAPEPAIAETARRPPSTPPKYARLELAGVRVRPIDDELRKFVAPEAMRGWRDPVAVEATTTTTLPSTIGDASPVLIINDQVYPDTWAIRPNRLIAFIPDRAVLRGQNKAEVMWAGGGAESRSRESRTFVMAPHN